MLRTSAYLPVAPSWAEKKLYSVTKQTCHAVDTNFGGYFAITRQSAGRQTGLFERTHFIFKWNASLEKMYVILLFIDALYERILKLSFHLGGLIFGGHHSQCPREEDSVKEGQKPQVAGQSMYSPDNLLLTLINRLLNRNNLKCLKLCQGPKVN